MNEQLIKEKKIIDCLYSHFKNTSKKLKIICDWDEVIQPHEPYALWLTLLNEKQKIDGGFEFSEYFKIFWNKKEEPWINYSLYGSRLVIENLEKLNKQQEIKNSPDFYQQTPFLTIAKELLKLIKEAKLEKLIFLSAYDKRKFPNEDSRKHQIFKETFGKFPFCSLQLIGFGSESQGANKADWIKKNTANFTVAIDDNPNICKNIAATVPSIIACAPHYLAVENQHHKEVLLIKTNVGDLDKGNFETDNYLKK